MALKVGIVGAGAIARPHMRAYVSNENVTEVHVADPSAEARDGLIGEYGIITEGVDDYAKLLADESIDIIDCCAPHNLHHPIARAAFNAGKHVITEKPIALTIKHADEMVNAAKRAKKRLFVAMNQRMLPAHRKAKEIIDEGVIGKPFLGVINVFGNEMARLNDPNSWKGDWQKAGGGALIDTGYHAVYMLQHFLGPAKAVTAMTKRVATKPKDKADDTSVVAMEMENGSMGNICVTYAATGDRWTEARQIVGPEGSIFITDDPDDEIPLIVVCEGEASPIKVHNPPQVQRYGIRQAIDHFIWCILESQPCVLRNSEARAALATVLAAYRSEREGRRVEVREISKGSD
ncbi:MAG TPA: Gfo/Idh/MocA family oxidoreductase [Armatimonadota bacterium]|nr:Gfo/Idh/MocA family oxidoreductase [Armatimonadota bacterium]